MVNPKYKHKPVAFTVKAFANGNYQYDGYRRVVEGAYQVQ